MMSNSKTIFLHLKVSFPIFNSNIKLPLHQELEAITILNSFQNHRESIHYSFLRAINTIAPLNKTATGDLHSVLLSEILNKFIAKSHLKKTTNWQFSRFLSQLKSIDFPYPLHCNLQKIKLILDKTIQNRNEIAIHIIIKTKNNENIRIKNLSKFLSLYYQTAISFIAESYKEYMVTPQKQLRERTSSTNNSFLYLLSLFNKQPNLTVIINSFNYKELLGTSLLNYLYIKVPITFLENKQLIFKYFTKLGNKNIIFREIKKESPLMGYIEIAKNKGFSFILGILSTNNKDILFKIDTTSNHNSVYLYKKKGKLL